MGHHWAPFNARASENMGCWLCEHFQRYDGGANPVLCEGECRKTAPRLSADVLTREMPVVESDQEGYFTFIPFGNTAWCSGFQTSLEENIPPSPGDTMGDCPNQELDDFTDPKDVRVPPGPFNKKSVENSCWFCIHFQRMEENPNDNAAGCTGLCCIQPPETWVKWDTQPGMFQEEYWHFGLIEYGPRVWCSRWKRVTHEVPDPPEFGGVLCQDPE